MWHEARKQEKMIRGMMVDYRRRAERRKDYYEKMKAEPLQILQLHGRRCKIHLDPAIAAAGDSPAIMMPWQGDTNNMIDRFDARAHLDRIADIKIPEIPPHQLPQEERYFNYERYRILAQNSFLGIGEDKFLAQLAIEEQFGVTLEEKEAQKEKLQDKKNAGAAIGYNYNNPDVKPVPPIQSAGVEASKKSEESDEDSDLEIIDVDLSIDVNKVEPQQAHELNAVGPLYGMAGSDLFSFLTDDADDADKQKQRAQEEKEKAMFSGRKSRRERRAHRDKKLALRVLSPPSYAAPKPKPARHESHSPSPSRSRSRSTSPDLASSVQFITSFGGDDEEIADKPAASKEKALYSEKVKENLRDSSYSGAVRGLTKRSSPAKSLRSPPLPARSRNSRSLSRSPYRSRSPHRRRSSSRKRSIARSKSPYYRNSRSKSPYRRDSRSKSPYSSDSRSKSPYHRSSRSKSPSRRISRSNSPYRSRSASNSSRSRSVRRSSRSRSEGSGGRRSSRSRSRSLVHNKRKRDSRSMSVDGSEEGKAGATEKAPLPRYYGRRKEQDSSSEVSLDSDTSDEPADTKSAAGAKSNTGQNQLRLTGSSSKVRRRGRG